MQKLSARTNLKIRIHETRRLSRVNGRVSTRDQHPEAQHDALVAAGCDKVFLDKASGKLARRPELDNALPRPTAPATSPS